jgi:beta-lactamase superfamily II metal-dependent hydrolase
MPLPRHLALACLAASLAVVSAPPAQAVTATGRLQIHHMDVGQGDGLLIISPLGQTALVDDGVYTDCTKVKAYLQALGVTQLDYHFASHYHADHVGCIDDLAAIGITVQTAGWDRGYSYTTGTYTAYVNTLGSKRRTLSQNQVILLDSLSAHPVAIKCVNLNGAGVYSVNGSDENAKCVVLKVSYGEFDAELGGDLTGSTTQGNDVESTIGPQVGPVEVYKAHHHGSRYSSNANWLNATKPKISIISCGTGNSYGHPTADALNRLHAANVRTYWTETGAGAAPNPAWDKVANDHIVISATWEPGGIDTVRSAAFADTFTNSGTAVDATLPTVLVSSPNGSETWKAGSAHSITWSASDNVGVTAVDLAYSTDGGATFPNTIATGLANSGSYAWSVPATPTGTARLRASARDAVGNTGTDASNANFTIDEWIVTASAGAGGSIAPSGPVQVVQGATQGFTISPAGGSVIQDVLVDGASVGAVTNYSFPGVAANHTIAASFASSPVGVDETPVALSLAAPVPNPSSDGWMLRFALPREGLVRLEIVDVTGRRLWSLEGSMSAGPHSQHWDAIGVRGGRVGAGLYFIRLTTPWGSRLTRGVMLR